MLREATNAQFVATRRGLRRRYAFVAGRLSGSVVLSPGEHARRDAVQGRRPVAVAEQGRRRYWWFRDRFWWDDERLSEDDVMALVLARERRSQRRLEHARAMMHGEAQAERVGIDLEVKRAVWKRCGGRCIECGTESLLEFDHVIPLAMGGSSSERNLQLLCAECNREKGAAL